MIWNKKGGLGDYLVSFYSYILIIAIILVFFTLFTINPKIVSEANVGVKMEEVNVNTALRNLVMVPVEFDDINWTYADLVIVTAKENNCKGDDLGPYCNLLIKESQKILENYKGGKWSLNLFAIGDDDVVTSIGWIKPKLALEIPDNCESLHLVSDFEDYKYLMLKLCIEK